MSASVPAFASVPRGTDALHALLQDVLRAIGPTVASVAGETGETDYQRRLGEVIVEVRVLRQMSQAELAVAIDRSEAALSRWETGKALPKAFDLRRIADALDMPAEWLLYPPPELITYDRLAVARAVASGSEEGSRPVNHRLRPAARRLRPRRRRRDDAGGPG